MIPDKIYTDNRGVYAELPIFSQIDANIEYIRKDALLEWAKEHYTGLDITKRDMWDGGYNCAIKEIIDKLNEM